MISRREELATRAREILGDDRLTAFLRAIERKSDVAVARLLNRDLNAGATIDDLFRGAAESATDRPLGEYEYQLGAVGDKSGTFYIAFGRLRLMPMRSDGGVWMVRFRGKKVGTVSLVTRWNW